MSPRQLSHVPPAPSRASSWLSGCQVASSVGRPEPLEGTGFDFCSLRVEVFANSPPGEQREGHAVIVLLSLLLTLLINTSQTVL